MLNHWRRSSPIDIFVYLPASAIVMYNESDLWAHLIGAVFVVIVKLFSILDQSVFLWFSK